MSTLFANEAALLALAAITAISANGLAATAVTPESGDESEMASSELETQPRARNIPFRIIETGAFGRQSGPYRRLITSRGQYRAMTGTNPPENLDFRDEWVIFYAAGMQSTGGFEARIGRLVERADGRGIEALTVLTAPGPTCIVPQVLTNPYVLIRFQRPATPPRVTFVQRNRVRNCSR